MPVLKLPAVITLTFDGRTVTLNPDEAGRYRLNDLHKASGAGANKRPNYWINNAQTTALIEKFSSAGIPAVTSINGGTARGSYGVREIVFAYAEWISADFHKAVLDTFSAAVDGDGKKAVKVAQSVARKEGIAVRKDFASQIGRVAGDNRTIYGDMTDVTNIIILGKPSDKMKEELGLKQYKPLRDALTDDQLRHLKAAEALSTALMAQVEAPTRGDMRQAVYTGAQIVAQALGLNRQE